jgi:hypothetical protein
MVKVNSQSEGKYSKDQLKQLQSMRSYVPLLEIMRDLTPQQSEALLPYLKSTCHDSLCVCIFNALFNFNKFTEDEKASVVHALKSKKDTYQWLGDKCNTCSKGLLKKRQRLLEQSGGAFPTILKPVLPIFAESLIRADKQKADQKRKKKHE